LGLSLKPGFFSEVLTFTSEQKSAFKQNYFKKLTFIMIFTDINWYRKIIKTFLGISPSPTCICL